MVLFKYRQSGSAGTSIWDGCAGRTASGVASDLLSDLEREFFLTTVKVDPQLTGSLASVAWDETKHHARLVSAENEAYRQPAVAQFLGDLQTALPGSIVANCRLQVFFSPTAHQGLHQDSFKSNGVRAILTLTSPGITKSFTLRDMQMGKQVTLELPGCTLLMGSDLFFGAPRESAEGLPPPPRRYSHGVEANEELMDNGKDFMASIIMDLKGVTVQQCKALLPDAPGKLEPEQYLDTTLLNRTGRMWFPFSHHGTQGGKAVQQLMKERLGEEGCSDWKAQIGQMGAIRLHQKKKEELGETGYSNWMSEIGRKGGQTDSAAQIAARENLAVINAKRTADSIAEVKAVAGDQKTQKCRRCSAVKLVEEFGAWTNKTSGRKEVSNLCRACRRKRPAGENGQVGSIPLQDVTNVESQGRTKLVQTSIAKFFK